MNVLIACEESQAVCIEFRKRGHNAYSCDLQNSSGGHPEWHFVGDCFEIIEGFGKMFVTESGELIQIPKWNILIGHPPCTYLSGAGNAWFDIEKYGIDALYRLYNRKEGKDFFFRMLNCGIEKICLENPVGHINGIFPPNQIIEPFYFGNEDRKRTCLWIKGLPKLVHIKTGDIFSEKTWSSIPKPSFIGKNGRARYFTDAFAPSDDRQKLRSKTFPGIAKAMAEQWG
jgi:hypothetical protein